ncbi:hypothetical protein QF012_000253 [Pseudomonas laurylsulfatiphila]
MFASLLFSVALNRGLEPYGDDEEFYVGVIIEPGGNSLLDRNASSGQYFCKA